MPEASSGGQTKRHPKLWERNNPAMYRPAEMYGFVGIFVSNIAMVVLQRTFNMDEHKLLMTKQYMQPY